MPNANNLRAGVQSEQPETPAYALVKFFSYPAEFDAIVFGTGGLLVNVAINSQADFLIQQLTLSVIDTVTFALVPVPASVLQLSDTSSSAAFMSGPTHPSNLFGTAAQPFILPRPYLIAGGGVLQVSLADKRGAGNPLTWYFNFIGKNYFKTT